MVSAFFFSSGVVMKWLLLFYPLFLLGCPSKPSDNSQTLKIPVLPTPPKVSDSDLPNIFSRSYDPSEVNRTDAGT